MDFWFGRALLLLGALSGVVAVTSKLVAWREKRQRSNVIEDVKGWLVTEDGQFFMASYLRKLKGHGRE